MANFSNHRAKIPLPTQQYTRGRTKKGSTENLIKAYHNKNDNPRWILTNKFTFLHVYEKTRVE